MMRLTQRRRMVYDERMAIENDIAELVLPLLEKRFKELKRDLRRANLHRRIKKSIPLGYEYLLWKADDIDWDAWISELSSTLKTALIDAARRLFGIEATFWTSRGEAMPAKGWDPQETIANYQTKISKYGRSLESIGTETEQKVKDALVNWYNKPDRDFSVLVDSLKPMFSIDRAQLIAQTETAGVSAEVNYEMMNHFQITQWRWDSFSDGHVCPICSGLNGQIFDVEDQDAYPPNHPACRCGQFFLPDAMAAMVKFGILTGINERATNGYIRTI